MIKSKTMLVASVAAVTTGAAFADLSIARECDADEGSGKGGASGFARVRMPAN